MLRTGLLGCIMALASSLASLEDTSVLANKERVPLAGHCVQPCNGEICLA
jgi:hypothetical protein